MLSYLSCVKSKIVKVSGNCQSYISVCEYVEYRVIFNIFFVFLFQIHPRLLLLLEQPIWIFIFLWYFDFRMGSKIFFNLLIGCREIRLLLLISFLSKPFEDFFSKTFFAYTIAEFIMNIVNDSFKVINVFPSKSVYLNWLLLLERVDEIEYLRTHLLLSLIEN